MRTTTSVPLTARPRSLAFAWANIENAWCRRQQCRRPRGAMVLGFHAWRAGLCQIRRSRRACLAYPIAHLSLPHGFSNACAASCTALNRAHVQAASRESTDAFPPNWQRVDVQSGPHRTYQCALNSFRPSSGFPSVSGATWNIHKVRFQMAENANGAGALSGQ